MLSGCGLRAPGNGARLPQQRRLHRLRSHAFPQVDDSNDAVDPTPQTYPPESPPPPLDDRARFVYDRQSDEFFKDNGAVFGQYTPYAMVEYSEDPRDNCYYQFNLDVEASVQHCFDFLHDWNNVVNSFDLIDTCVPDGLDDSAAIIMLFYRWGQTPPIQMLFALHRESQLNETVAVGFQSSQGGLLLDVLFVMEPLEDGRTRVEVEFEHGMPMQLKDFAGQFAIETHVRQILEENLEVMKQLMEGKMTAADLPAYHEENRMDELDGNELTKPGHHWVDDLPHMELDSSLPKERKLHAEAMAREMQIIQELVHKGHFRRTAEGVVRSDVSPEHEEEYNEMVRFHRHFQCEDLSDKPDVLKQWQAIDNLLYGEDPAQAQEDQFQQARDEEIKEVFKGVKELPVTDVYGKEVGRVPIKMPEVVAKMSPEAEEKYVMDVAEGAGMKEEFVEYKERIEMNDEEQEEAQRMVDEEEKATEEQARAEGMDPEEWTQQRVREATRRLYDIMGEEAEASGWDTESMMDTIHTATIETEALARQLGVSQETVIKTMDICAEDFILSETKLAEMRGWSYEAHAQLEGCIRSGGDQKAEKLGLSDREYEKFAWAALAEAKKRGELDKDGPFGSMLDGADQSEIDWTIKHPVTGKPWTYNEEAARRAAGEGEADGGDGGEEDTLRRENISSVEGIEEVVRDEGKSKAECVEELWGRGPEGNIEDLEHLRVIEDVIERMPLGKDDRPENWDELKDVKDEDVDNAVGEMEEKMGDLGMMDDLQTMLENLTMAPSAQEGDGEDDEAWGSAREIDEEDHDGRV